MCLAFIGCAKWLDVAFDMCGNDILRSVPSPDGKLTVVVFQRDCGATTGFSTQGSVLRSGEKLPNESGMLFIMDDNDGAAPTGPGGGPEAQVKWEGNRQVLIQHHPRAQVYSAQKQVTVRLSWSHKETVTARYVASAKRK